MAKKKEFVRSGNVIAFRQGGKTGNWWTVFPNDDNPEGAFEVYIGTNVDGFETLDNLIEVLNKIKKQGA